MISLSVRFYIYANHFISSFRRCEAKISRPGEWNRASLLFSEQDGQQERLPAGSSP